MERCKELVDRILAYLPSENVSCKFTFLSFLGMVRHVCTLQIFCFLQFQNGADGLTRAELEEARQQLEEAKRREEEQRKIIEDLKRQKQQMEQQQKRLGQSIMGDTLSVASISNIALHGSQVRTPLPLLCQEITVLWPMHSSGLATSS